jgi:gluconolactonase
VLDPKFERLKIFSAGVERLATGMRWVEGPVWFGDGGYLVWSDIPNNKMMKWEETTGRVSVFRNPSNYSNGNCRDREGRLITCEHLTRRISRTEYDGSVATVCDNYNGKRLNSPNDVTTKSDGSIWSIRLTASAAITSAVSRNRSCRRTSIGSMQTDR